MLEQRATGAVHHALGQPRRARRVHHVQRVVEREPREVERRAVPCTQRGAPPDPVVDRRLRSKERVASRCRVGREVRHHDDTPHRGERRDHIPCASDDVDRLVRVSVAVGNHQHLRLDLPEPVEDPRRTEVGRARGPERADRRRGKHRHDGFGNVRQVARDPIAFVDAALAQKGGEAGDVARKLGVRQCSPPALLRPEDQRRAIIAMAQQVLGEVEPRARKPAWTLLRIGRRNTRAADQHVVPRLGSIPRVSDHVDEAPELGPEQLGFGDRPFVQ